MILTIISMLYLQEVSCFIDKNNNSYTFYQVTAFNTRERSVLYNIHVKNDAIIFLNSVTNEASSPMYVIARNCCTEEFEITLKSNDIEFIIVQKNSLLEEFEETDITYDNDDNQDNSNDQIPELNEHFFDWEDVMIWIQNRIKKNALVNKIIIGETYEKRELFVLKLSNGIKKPAVFILGGEQGRDWTSPAVILNFINYLLSNRLDSLLTLYDFYFMPVFNPDGFEYSMKKDRFWNKNRKHFYPERICDFNEHEIAIGVNIDRNWHFSKSTYFNDDDDECDSVYIGHKSLTEEEPSALSSFLNTIAVDLMAYMDIRGFEKLIAVPYANTNEDVNNAVLIEILLHASDKVFVQYNVSYNICSTGNCFYNYTGNSPDWVKKNMNVPIVFTLYLKDEKSFLPHIKQIHPLLLQFTVILKETLLLAHSIYGPLFNYSIKQSTSLIILALLSFLCTAYKLISQSS